MILLHFPAAGQMREPEDACMALRGPADTVPIGNAFANGRLAPELSPRFGR